jgi:hypothetical protein
MGRRRAGMRGEGKPGCRAEAGRAGMRGGGVPGLGAGPMGWMGWWCWGGVGFFTCWHDGPAGPGPAPPSGPAHRPCLPQAPRSPWKPPGPERRGGGAVARLFRRARWIGSTVVGAHADARARAHPSALPRGVRPVPGRTLRARKGGRAGRRLGLTGPLAGAGRAQGAGWSGPKGPGGVGPRTGAKRRCAHSGEGGGERGRRDVDVT